MYFVGNIDMAPVLSYSSIKVSALRQLRMFVDNDAYGIYPSVDMWCQWERERERGERRDDILQICSLFHCKWIVILISSFIQFPLLTLWYFIDTNCAEIRNYTGGQPSKCHLWGGLNAGQHRQRTRGMGDTEVMLME